MSDPNDETPLEPEIEGPRKKYFYTPAIRSEWTEAEEILFFNFLGNQMRQGSHQFNCWKKPNKKGIFKQMHTEIVTKDQVQCRLKFYSYKRKHSSKKNKFYFKPCMRTVIMEKLTQHAEIDE